MNFLEWTGLLFWALVVSIPITWCMDKSIETVLGGVDRVLSWFREKKGKGE